MPYTKSILTALYAWIKCCQIPSFLHLTLLHMAIKTSFQFFIEVVLPQELNLGFQNWIRYD